MLSLAGILAAVGALVAQAPAFVALGIDIVDAFGKAKALIAGDTASTPEERAAAMTEIEALEAQRDARLEELRLQAPNS